MPDPYPYEEARRLFRGALLNKWPARASTDAPMLCWHADGPTVWPSLGLTCDVYKVAVQDLVLASNAKVDFIAACPQAFWPALPRCAAFGQTLLADG